MINLTFSRKQEVWIYDTLKRAQDTYGNSNQIMVAIEELCELSSVIFAKGSQEELLDEIADVYVVLQHVCMIFGIKVSEYFTMIEIRNPRWLTELASRLCKYPRYENNEDALDGIKPDITHLVVKCYMLLITLRETHGLSDQKVSRRVLEKILRVERWLDESTQFKQSLIDREVGTIEAE